MATNHSFKLHRGHPVDIDGEHAFIFTEFEIIKVTKEFRFTLVLNF